MKNQIFLALQIITGGSYSASTSKGMTYLRHDDEMSVIIPFEAYKVLGAISKDLKNVIKSAEEEILNR